MYKKCKNCNLANQRSYLFQIYLFIYLFVVVVVVVVVVITFDFKSWVQKRWGLYSPPPNQSSWFLLRVVT